VLRIIIGLSDSHTIEHLNFFCQEKTGKNLQFSFPVQGNQAGIEEGVM
jgi:hypothetical protein